jgi:hypothetical protein
VFSFGNDHFAEQNHVQVSWSPFVGRIPKHNTSRRKYGRRVCSLARRQPPGPKGWATRRDINMKYAFILALMLAPSTAWANNCNNPAALTEAQKALLNAYNYTDPADVQLSNIQVNTLVDGEQVCIGEVTTPKFSTNAAWTLSQTPMGWDAAVVQAIDPQHFVTNDTGQSDQDQQGDQVAANNEAAEWQQMQPKCEDVRLHPLKYKLKALAQGKPADAAEQACAQLDSLNQQMVQKEQQDGITADPSQATAQQPVQEQPNQSTGLGGILFGNGLNNILKGN